MTYKPTCRPCADGVPIYYKHCQGCQERKRQSDYGKASNDLSQAIPATRSLSAKTDSS